MSTTHRLKARADGRSHGPTDAPRILVLPAQHGRFMEAIRLDRAEGSRQPGTGAGDAPDMDPSMSYKMKEVIRDPPHLGTGPSRGTKRGDVMAGDG